MWDNFCIQTLFLKQIYINLGDEMFTITFYVLVCLTKNINSCQFIIIPCKLYLSLYQIGFVSGENSVRAIHCNINTISLANMFWNEIKNCILHLTVEGPADIRLPIIVIGSVHFIFTAIFFLHTYLQWNTKVWPQKNLNSKRTLLSKKNDFNYMIMLDCIWYDSIAILKYLPGTFRQRCSINICS